MSEATKPFAREVCTNSFKNAATLGFPGLQPMLCCTTVKQPSSKVKPGSFFSSYTNLGRKPARASNCCSMNMV